MYLRLIREKAVFGIQFANEWLKNIVNTQSKLKMGD